ncbi:MAG: M48 family metallopeptidase [Lautropia sp.]|nr:M48 family metallopeptidase [Lautropia sp.]
MQPLHFSLLFVSFLLASMILRLWLASRQIRHVSHHRQQVPPAFAERIGLHAHQRAATYTIARVQLGMIEQAWSAVLLVTLTLLGGLQFISQLWLQWLPASPLGQQMGIVTTTLLLLSLAELPLDLWRHFRLESRFGFNRMNLGLFFTDRLKGLVIGAVLGLPLLAAILALMQHAPHWWLWAWLLWLGFSTGVALLYPALIAPWFNRFQPLPEGPVRQRVERLLARTQFQAGGLFMIDGSRRSAHGNAYFAGAGKARRIVFYDTLLERLDASEIEAVLAHELGHFKCRHILKRLGLQAVLSLAGFALLGWLATQPWFYLGLGLRPDLSQATPPAGVALLLFMLVMPVFSFMLRPLMAWLSRRDEFEADAFAVGHSDGQALVSALAKLYEDNASTLTPDPLHSAFYDSHPPALVRITRIQSQLDAPLPQGATA